MRHARPSKRAQKHRNSECRKGRHRYGPAQDIGARIERRVCDTCGAVTIDLTRADQLTTPTEASSPMRHDT